MLNGKGQWVLCSSPGGTWLIRALLCVVRFMLVLQLGMVLINFICFGFPCDSRAAQNPLPWRSPLLQNLLALLWGLHVANQNGTEMAGCPVWKSVALCFWGMLCSVGEKKHKTRESMMRRGEAVVSECVWVDVFVLSLSREDPVRCTFWCLTQPIWAFYLLYGYFRGLRNLGLSES